MLEEPFGRPVGYSRRGNPFSALNDPFFNGVPGIGAANVNVPAVDVSEEPNAFVLEAEVPGAKKENVDVRIGDNGQSLTIEGRTFVKSQPDSDEVAQTSSSETPTNSKWSCQPETSKAFVNIRVKSRRADE